MQSLPLGGAGGPLEAGGEESQHLQLQTSLENIPSGFRGGLTLRQLLHSLCCCFAFLPFVMENSQG